MKSLLACIMSALLATVVVPNAFAQNSADVLGKCLADNTTGRDRKDLARWMFSAMGAHPEMSDLYVSAQGTGDKTAQVAAALFTRLLADACPNETKAAVAEGGGMAIQRGFQVLGQLAMQELMTNPQVAASIGAMERHLDNAKLEPVFGGSK
ncbi:MAG: hypothetical protein H6926_06780 [Chromatiales bacterium]|nr:hypothetical protein [Chromatiales bacterium]